MQKVMIIGRLGKEPEMRYTPSGKAVTSFSVATSKKYKNNKGEDVQETIWWKCAAWEKLADICNEYLHKGSHVYIEGTMKGDNGGNPRIWTAQDGTARASFELWVSSMEMLNSKAENEALGSSSVIADSEPEPVAAPDEDF